MASSPRESGAGGNGGNPREGPLSCPAGSAPHRSGGRRGGPDQGSEECAGRGDPLHLPLVRARTVHRRGPPTGDGRNRVVGGNTGGFTRFDRLFLGGLRDGNRCK